jgi:hypothetical protein
MHAQVCGGRAVPRGDYYSLRIDLSFGARILGLRVSKSVNRSPQLAVQIPARHCKGSMAHPEPATLGPCHSGWHGPIARHHTLPPDARDHGRHSVTNIPIVAAVMMTAVAQPKPGSP